MSISAAQKKAYEVLSPRHYQFCIPPYQRPYAWNKDQAKALIDDLIDAFEESPAHEYFLGSIVIVKRSSASVRAEVVDGQQRLTSLSILVAAVRDLMPAEDRSDLTSLLLVEFMGERSIGLKLRSSDSYSDDDFFDKFVRSEAGFEALKSMQAVLPSSQQCIRNNALTIRAILEERLLNVPANEIARLRDFLSFVLQKTCLVVVESTSFDSAYRIFSTMNNRGLPLGVSDLIKALVLEPLRSDEERQSINQVWEQEEADLTRLASSSADESGDSRRYFELLFSHIHRIKTKRRATKNIYDDFKKDVLGISPSSGGLTPSAARNFVEGLLVESSNAYEAILKKAIETGDANASRSVNLLYLPLLENIGNSDWQPAAISYISQNRFQLSEAKDFFRLLERTAAVSLILGENINKRAKRYGPILSSIESYDCNALEIIRDSVSETEAEEVLRKISGDLYGESYAFYVMLRLDSALAEGGISISLSAPRASIEHVAPQTLKKEWTSDWNNQDHLELKNKLGNLVLLSRRKNSQAQNYDFETKKKVYFAGKAHVSNSSDQAGRVAAFPSVTRVLNAGQRWTPKIVYKNQDEYVSLLKRVWDL